MRDDERTQHGFQFERSVSKCIALLPLPWVGGFPRTDPCKLPPSCADKGVDRVVSAQGSLTRDTVYLVNGAQVGDRDIITVSARSLSPNSSM